jgi:hypothetical protein
MVSIRKNKLGDKNMDYKLDGITLNQLIPLIYCGKCNSGLLSDKKEDMKEGTNFKESSEIYHSTGTTKVLWCPKCLNKIKICIPNNETFWDILDNAFNEEEKS